MVEFERESDAAGAIIGAHGVELASRDMAVAMGIDLGASRTI